MQRHHTTTHLFLGILFFGALLLCMSAPVAAAQHEAASAESIAAVDGILAEELTKLLGGWVSITLNSGAIFSGKVMKVRDGMVHIGQIQNKEYYEALVRISDISALGARFRSRKNKK